MKKFKTYKEAHSWYALLVQALWFDGMPAQEAYDIQREMKEIEALVPCYKCKGEGCSVCNQTGFN